MNEKAGHYQIWLCRHWVGGSGVVKLSFYGSNPGKRTTVPDRIPQVYIHKFPTGSTGKSLYEYKVKYCSRFQHFSEGEEYKLKHLMDIITKVSTTAENISDGRVLVVHVKISPRVAPQLNISRRVAVGVKTSRGHRA